MLVHEVAPACRLYPVSVAAQESESVSLVSAEVVCMGRAGRRCYGIGLGWEAEPGPGSHAGS